MTAPEESRGCQEQEEELEDELYNATGAVYEAAIQREKDGIQGSEDVDGEDEEDDGSFLERHSNLVNIGTTS